jgi:hypothetical protein
VESRGGGETVHTPAPPGARLLWPPTLPARIVPVRDAAPAGQGGRPAGGRPPPAHHAPAMGTGAAAPTLHESATEGRERGCSSRARERTIFHASRPAGAAAPLSTCSRPRSSLLVGRQAFPCPAALDRIPLPSRYCPRPAAHPTPSSGANPCWRLDGGQASQGAGGHNCV